MSANDQATEFERFENEIEAQIDTLTAAEEITADDLEAFRQRLPTDPQAAELVELALPWPFSALFEYVTRSDRQAAYWRVRPDRSQPRSEADREHRARFAAAARSAEGLRGTTEHQGQKIPRSAALVAEQVAESGSDTAGSGSGEKALRRLRTLLGTGSKVTE